MILYLDTSALVKLFFSEAGSKLVIELIGKADAVVTSQVAYSEACSALARRRRDKRLTDEEFEAATKRLDEVWPQMDSILVDELKAGELAFKHILRGFDAIHLAAALELRMVDDRPIEIGFCSFDDRQNAAARAESLIVFEAQDGSPAG